MKQLIAAVLFGLALCTPLVWSQTSGFSQQGKVTHEMRDDGYSIAHSSLPLNSKVKIANPSNGKEIDVTITRLIPASSNRIADVSSGVWEELGLTPDTDVRIYTTVSAKPQPAVAQPAAKSAQTGTNSDNMPASVKFENNNNFIINGVPAGIPSAVTSETRTQTPQPAVASETRTQTPQPSYYETRPQTTPSAVTYETDPQTTPSAVAYDTQTKTTPSAAASETRPQTAQPVVETRPVQPAAAANIWEQIMKPAAAIEARPQTTQPAVAYETRSAQPAVANDIWAQIIKPVVETRTQPAQPAAVSETRPQQVPVLEDTSPSVNEILAQASSTFVFIDAPPGTPRPSVTINNGTLSYLPPVPNEMRQQQAQSAASYVTSPANSNVRVENWSQQTSQSSQQIITNETRPSQQKVNDVAPTQGVVNYDTRTQQVQPAITFETRTIEVPVDQAGKPLWDAIPTPGNEVFSPVSNSRVFIDAPPTAVRPSVIINNATLPGQ